MTRPSVMHTGTHLTILSLCRVQVECGLSMIANSARYMQSTSRACCRVVAGRVMVWVVFIPQNSNFLTSLEEFLWIICRPQQGATPVLMVIWCKGVVCSVCHVDCLIYMLLQLNSAIGLAALT